MSWAFLALISAFFTASYDAAIKRFLKGNDPWFLASGAFLATGAISGVISLFVGIPEIGPGFLGAVGMAVALATVAISLYYSALKYADVSLVMPMLAFTPVVLVISAYFSLGEVPSSAGLAGILLIAAGSYLLNVDDNHHFNAAQPVKSMFKNKYSRRALIAACLFGFVVNFDKVAILNSDPFFANTVGFFSLGLVFFILNFVRNPGLKKYATHSPKFLFLGVLLAIGNIAIAFALTLSLAAYAVALRRIGLVFGVLYGNYLFHEKHFAQRIMATLVMLLGALIITLKG